MPRAGAVRRRGRDVGRERGGFVAADRVAQNTAKFLSPLIAGAVVVMTNIATMFLLLGLLAGAWAVVMGMAFSFGWVKARS